MVWPAASVSDSRLIDTPLAWPVTTIWNASNSFFAAAIFAAAVAPAGGRAGAASDARATAESAAATGSSTCARAHWALPRDVIYRTLPGVVAAGRRCLGRWHKLPCQLKLAASEGATVVQAQKVISIGGLSLCAQVERFAPGERQEAVLRE